MQEVLAVFGNNREWEGAPLISPFEIILFPQLGVGLRVGLPSDLRIAGSYLVVVGAMVIEVLQGAINLVGFVRVHGLEELHNTAQICEYRRNKKKMTGILVHNHIASSSKRGWAHVTEERRI